jgi:putative PIG3 family NAD(P)H quinone oxidoreductase
MEESERMRAIVITEFGDPEVLEVQDLPRPHPGPGEIRVRVRASGVNRADLSQRRGRYPAPPGWPEDIPGLEYAGVVDAVGHHVERWRPGDLVMGIVGGGGYAQYVVTDASTAVRAPRGLALEEAGAVPEVFMTAYDALFRQVGLGEGETLLVHAVGSGVGTAAAQLARASGVRVIGTSRSREKIERARDLGVDVGILASEDWPARVRERTDGRGVDVILDLVGAPYLQGNLQVLRGGGRQIVVGVPGGSRAQIDLRLLMSKRATLRGTVLRARAVEEKAALAAEFEARVVPLLEEGRLRPVLDRVFPPERARQAHEWMEENRNFGKIVLLWD